ncbi:hypothetical protein [Dactylosporangium fulvum]|uniref:Gram-positive cocci surface proteins LPxTG domain-containing protein n=1 Tax=Dactylosporangium fulvum TaxID=53359 RepID=A0ABY5WCU8_9ACTN|nr:hypothetical protein [Dactylosporangium fulvum]UWP86563.1 hypothetical protein Dfulv_20915 [Dactylosporangium fulvum]
MGVAQAAPSCTNGFTASAQTDMLRLRVLDLPVLQDQPLLGLKLLSAGGTVDSRAAQNTSVAHAEFAEAQALGLDPAEVATSRSIASPSGAAGPQQKQLTAVDVPGLLNAQAGTLMSDASWHPGYRCGQTGPLTRSLINLGSVTLLPGSSGRVTAARADGSATSASLLRVDTLGAAQAITQLVRLPDGHVGVAAGAGPSLAGVSLFEGTRAEVSVKVVSAPKLSVIAAGTAAGSLVDYQPAVLQVTAAGLPVAEVSAQKLSAGIDVNASLRGRTTGPSLLSVNVSVGELERAVTDSAVSAEAATLRLRISLGKLVILDVSLGYLQVKATSDKPWTATVAERTSNGGQSRPDQPSVIVGSPVAAESTTPPQDTRTLDPVAVTEQQPHPAKSGLKAGSLATTALILASAGAAWFLLARRHRRRT